MQLTQINKRPCNLEHQYTITDNGQDIGHVLSVIARKGIAWEIVTIITSGAVHTLKASERTKTAALRQRRRHLAQIPSLNLI